MTDRKLLELAAKAAGLSVLRYEHDYGLAIEGIGAWWNPLMNDGQALRLAVGLGIGYEFTHDEMSVMTFSVRDDSWHVTEMCGNDSYAATRRAIVRAAAALGSAKTGEAG